MATESAQIALTDLSHTNIYDRLTELDQNQDGSLEFSEVQAENLLTPSAVSSMEIESEADFVLYKKLVDSAKITQAYRRFLDTTEQQSLSGTEGLSAEEWIADRGAEFMAYPPERVVYISYIKLLDILPYSNGYQLLFAGSHKENGESFFFTVNLHDNPDDNKLQMGGLLLDLNKFFPDPTLDSWRQQLLKDLFVTLIYPLEQIPADFLATQRDRIEALMIQANPDMVNIYEPSSTDQDTPVTPEVTERVNKSEQGEMPQRQSLTRIINNQQISLPLSSENELTDYEKKRLSWLWQQMPPELLENLVKNDIISEEDGLALEVVETDILAGMGFRWAGALYDSNYNKIFFSRSYLNNAQDTFLVRLVIHELVHSLDANLTDFFVPYFKQVRSQLSAEYNPTVDPYGLNSSGENFAENVVAYFVGETDPDPAVCFSCGPLSRDELRKKQPEMYLAIKLFFEKSSPLFGDPIAFSKDTKLIYDKMLAQKKVKDIALAATTPASEIYNYYHRISTETKLIADLVDLHNHDSHNGYYNHRYVYDHFDVDGDDTSDRMLVNEKTKYDAKKQQWTSTTRVVMLKQTPTGTQRLEAKVTFTEGMKREDFLAHGLNPLFRGLFLVQPLDTSEKHLRLKTRLKKEVNFYLEEDNGRYHLNSVVDLL